MYEILLVPEPTFYDREAYVHSGYGRPHDQAEARIGGRAAHLA